MLSFAAAVDRVVESAVAADVRKLYARLADQWEAFSDEVDRAGGKVGEKVVWAYRGIYFVDAAKAVAYHVIREKAIPDGVVGKAFQAAANIVTGAKRQPRDLTAWRDGMATGVKLLLQTETWPSKEGTDAVIDFEGLRLHNVVAVDSAKLDAIKAGLRRGLNAIRTSGIPRSKEIIYGDVFLVGQIGGVRSAAFYKIATDEVYVKILPKYGGKEIHFLIHELGHRYWKSFAPESVKQAWRAYDRAFRDAAGSGPTPPLPKVGDPIPPLMLSKKDAGAVVQRIVPHDRGGLRFYVSDRGYFTSGQLNDFHRQHAKLTAFPTVYAGASNDAEEHFCECFGLYCTADLPEPHFSKFREIVLR